MIEIFLQCINNQYTVKCFTSIDFFLIYGLFVLLICFQTLLIFVSNFMLFSF